MHLTDHELTAASSVVAALAIVGGYLGVRSANRNALTIAREERSTRYRDEMNALKRTLYARCLINLDAAHLALIGKSQATDRQALVDAMRSLVDELLAATRIVVELDLITPAPVVHLATEAMRELKDAYGSDEPDFDNTLGVAKLQFAMRYDLSGISIPDPQTLSLLVENHIRQRRSHR